MPRNITVTFADGSTHVYQNAPDNVTPEQVSARAQQDFGKRVKALDGGRGQAAQAPAPRQTPKPAPKPSFGDNAMSALAATGGALWRGAAAVPDLILDAGDAVSSGFRNVLAGTGDALLRAHGAPGAAKWWTDTVAPAPAPNTKIKRFADIPDALGVPRLAAPGAELAANFVGGMMTPGPRGQTPSRVRAPVAPKPRPSNPAAQVVQDGERAGVRVMTSDVKPPRTFIGKTAQAIGERIPITGTGGMRAAQQEQRIAAVKSVLEDHGAITAEGATDAVAADLAKTRGAMLERLTKAKDSVIKSLSAPIESAPPTIAAAGGDDVSAQIPNLNHYTGSWVAVDRQSGKAVTEIFDRSIAEKVNVSKFQLLPANEYLGRLNALIKNAGGVEPSADALKAALGIQPGTVRPVAQSVAESVTRNVPTPQAIKAIDEQIVRLSGINADKFAPVIRELESFKANLSSGKTLEQIEGNRKLLGDLFKDPSLAAIAGDGQKALNAIYGPLRSDMGNFIKTNGGQAAFNKWKGANDQLAAIAGELNNGTFKKVLADAEATPENVAKLLFSKKPSDVARLYSNLSAEGRAKAQSAILHKAMQDAGGIDGLSPDRFANNIARLGRTAGVHFDPADLARLDGLSRVLNVTKRAAQSSVAPPTGVQAAPYAMGAGFTGLFGVTGGIGAAAMTGLLARAYESAPVRNALLRLGRAPKGSAIEATQLDRAAMAITAAIKPYADKIAAAANENTAPALAADPTAQQQQEQQPPLQP